MKSTSWRRRARAGFKLPEGETAIRVCKSLIQAIAVERAEHAMSRFCGAGCISRARARLNASPAPSTRWCERSGPNSRSLGPAAAGRDRLAHYCVTDRLRVRAVGSGTHGRGKLLDVLRPGGRGVLHAPGETIGEAGEFHRIGGG